jgi:NADH:ubiquinone oxidoreductase subunit B-like Fe-S oxidoreductase
MQEVCRMMRCGGFFVFIGMNCCGVELRNYFTSNLIADKIKKIGA